MAGTAFEKGKNICISGQPMTALHLIVEGKVQASYPGGSYLMGRGSIIGICEISSEIHFLEYQAVEETSVFTYPLNSLDSLGELLRQHPELARLFLVSAFYQINALFQQCSLSEPKCHNMTRELADDMEIYQALCTRYRLPVRTLTGLESMPAYLGEEASDMWLSDMYLGLQHVYSGEAFKPLVAEPGISMGLLRKCALDFRRNFTALEEQYLYRKQLADFYFPAKEEGVFDLLTSLYSKLGSNCEDADSLLSYLRRIGLLFQKDPAICTAEITGRLRDFEERLAKEASRSALSADAPSLAQSPEELRDSLNTILNFAQADGVLASAFKQHIQDYSALPDKSDTEDETCRLRKNLTQEFHQLYALAFKRTLQTKEIPMAVKLFLYFGYVDEELAGAENAAMLYDLVLSRPDRSEFGIYTFYEWLLAIYNGKKEPSRNEFDQDYFEYVHKKKASGHLTDAQIRDLEDNPMNKVNYELENLFPSVNKMTFGRPATYCPVFSADNVLKSLQDSYVTLSQVSRAFETIKKADYSAFYRESYDFEHMDVMGKETIHLEFLPDIILMPNVGVRGVMWQEIQGKIRNSSGRMAFSIFHMEDFTTSMVRLAGEFRWEMCKRIQGGRWNDISEPSLTSEYFDYIQFYKKNHDLSNEAREKVRTSLQRAKNSFKEMFVRDYIIWVLFEGNGSPRLNKVARRILFTYCPFPADVLATAEQNPLYTELLHRHRILTKQRIHHLDMLSKKIANSGSPIPDTLVEEIKFAKGDFSS